MNIQIRAFRIYLGLWLLIGHSAYSLAAIIIQSQLDDGPWNKDIAIYPLVGQTVKLKVQPVAEATIHWYQIFPDLSKIYKNANHPWEPHPYQWVGFGKIDYTRRELVPFQGQWEIQPFPISTSTKIKDWFKAFWPTISTTAYFKTAVGSFWFQVEIEKAGKIINSSAGIEQADARGLSPTVFRISVREGEGYLGYLTSFFNVPGLFGSTTYQSENYLGVDCADVLITAYSLWKGTRLDKNYNVGMLINRFPKVTELVLAAGVPNKSLRWQHDLLPGDLIAVKYSGAKQYQHIGALASDANNNGVLDENDQVIHAGPLPLQYSLLKTGSFDGQVIILRPK